MRICERCRCEEAVHFIERFITNPRQPPHEELCTDCYNVERAEAGLRPIQEEISDMFDENGDMI